MMKPSPERTCPGCGAPLERGDVPCPGCAGPPAPPAVPAEDVVTTRERLLPWVRGQRGCW